MTVTGTLRFFPQWLVTETGLELPCGMRAFGTSTADLGVTFQSARQPELTTELLALCCRTAGDAPVDRQLLLQVPIGMRTEALMTLASLSDPSPFCWQARCASPECGLQIEFELTLDQIVSLEDERREQQNWMTEICGTEVLLRHPTGLDQAEWLAFPPAIQCEAMLRSIIVQPSLEEMLAKGESLESLSSALDEAMDEFDPLVGFHLSVVCPHCSGAADVSPDLAGLALERLFRAQQALIDDVHRLATRYHWSEQQVLELPQWRRQRYLELIEEAC